MQNKIIEELTCPITLEVFRDPISVPCCGQTFSRHALIEAFENQLNDNKTCPLCNGDLSKFDPKKASSNKNILSFVELMNNQQTINEQLNILSNIKPDDDEKHEENDDNKQESQQWSIELNKMYDINNKLLNIGELQINLNNSLFDLVTSLFIVVVDKSGSMSGSPWSQVQTALMHINGITNTNKLIHPIIIAYDSSAQIINDFNKIKTMRAGGGTNFQSAFDKIKEIFIKYKKQCIDNTINKNVAICFLTDGRDNCSKKDELVPNFKKLVKDYWIYPCNGNVTTHTIGFGSSCDKEFLEELRTLNYGTFRYAEPSDHDEMLCEKLKSLFDKISQSTSIPIQLNISKCNKLFKFYTPQSKQRQINHDDDDDDDDEKEEKINDNMIEIQFPLNADKSGIYNQWIEWMDKGKDDEDTKYDDDDNTIDVDNKFCVEINSEIDKNVNIVINICNKNKNNKESNTELFDKWILTLTDDLATQIYNLSNKIYESYDENIFDLHCALIQQNCESIQGLVQNQSLLNKIEYLINAIVSLRDGLTINTGKISDLRFGSQFNDNLTASNDNNTNNNIQRQEVDLFEAKTKEKKERLHKYPFNNIGKKRNKLQELIMNMVDDAEIIEFLNTSSINKDDILYCDVDENNTLQLAAYAGKFNVVEEILKQYNKYIDIQYVNKDNETALTLAIKKRGYYKTMRILLRYGAKIDDDRSKPLEQFAINSNYIITAKIIRDLRTNSTDPSKSMSKEYLIFLYEDAIAKNQEIDTQKYLEIFLYHKMIKYVKLLINKHGGKPDIKMLLNYCIPPKPDHEETEIYLNLCKILIAADNTLINQKNDLLETPLFKSAEKGSLPHVQYFISLSAVIDEPNYLGNTPFWISTAKLYPCIMKEFIKCGADINYMNHKGNPPIYNLCQGRGNEKICNILLSTNKVKIENVINKNGDTLILICCRNNNYKILKLLLNYVSTEFVNFAAHIDGFNAIFASVESNSIECIKLLYDYGINLNQKTDDDNKIIAGATPLHLSCYYKRFESTKTLLNLGANPNVVDNIHRQTPLILGVIQLNYKIIQLLARKTDILLKDKYNNTALSYCKNNMEIRKLLINPLLDILIKLSIGKFDDKKVKIACNVLQKYCGLKACFTTKQSVNIQDSDGMTPLLYAVINKNYNITKTLLSLNTDPNIKNKFGLNAFIFNKWIKNIKIEQLLNKYNKPNDIEYINKSIDTLQKTNDLSWFDSFALNINTMKSNIFEILTNSGIITRMQSYINHTNNINDDDDDSKSNEDESFTKNLLSLNYNEIVKKYDEMVIENTFKLNDYNKNYQFDNNKYLNLVLNSKLFTINFIGGTNNNNDEPLKESKQVFLLNLLTNNNILFSILNYEIINKSLKPNINILYSIKLLNNILDKLPNCIDEVFIGCSHGVARSLFLMNNIFSWKSFISGSSQWRTAINGMNNFNSHKDKKNKKNEGTVFLIQSKTGKHIGKYSQFSFESEVIFKPNTKFRVIQWYKGDVICLGQKNIRKNTFGIDKMEDINKYLNNNNSLIIELQEISSSNNQ